MIKLHFRPLLIVVVAASLAMNTGCDSGTQTNFPSSRAPAKLTGHVFNDDGPVTKAKIEVRDGKGQLIASTELKGSGQYSLSLPAGVSYPLIVNAQPADPSEAPIKAAVTSDLAREQDLSPVTTIVVETAMNLGGINETNLTKAAGAAIAQRKKSGGGGGGGGTTSQSFKGDPTKQYGGWH